MKRWFSDCVLVIVLFLLVAGCGSEKVSEERINNVERVFYHENRVYSVLVEKDKGIYKIMGLPAYFCSPDVQVLIIPDVDSEKKMWISVSFLGRNRCVGQMKIHIHSPKEVEGGGWNHGKLGRGQTSVLK